MNTQWRKPIQLIVVATNDAEAEAIRRACLHGGLNCEVTHFLQATEALSALQGPLGRSLLLKPYLILLDLDFSGDAGIAFLDSLRADPLLRRSIVFALSDSARDEDKAAAYDRRVAGYLVKSGLNSDYSTLCELLDVYEKSIQFPLG